MAAEPSSETTATGIVDTQLLGKPTTLAGEEGECNDWAFVMKSYLSCVAEHFMDAINACAFNSFCGEKDLQVELSPGVSR